MKIPKDINRFSFQHPRASFDLHAGSIYCDPAWLVPTSPGAVMLAASETPTVTAARAKSACMTVPSQRTEQHMEGLGFLPSSARSGQDSACNSSMHRCSGDNAFHSKGSAGRRQGQLPHGNAERPQSTSNLASTPLSSAQSSYGHYPYGTKEKPSLRIAGVDGAWVLTPRLYRMTISTVTVTKPEPFAEVLSANSFLTPKSTAVKSPCPGTQTHTLLFPTHCLCSI